MSTNLYPLPLSPLLTAWLAQHRWLELSPPVLKGLGSKHRLNTIFVNKSLFTQQGIGTRLSSELSKVKGSEREMVPQPAIELP